MIYYLKGKVTMIDGESIVLDIHNIGYQVLVSDLSKYKVGEEAFVYVYNVIREDDQYLIGFSSLEEKKVFSALIKVKGLGPKTVINALRATTVEAITNAISANNVAYLKKLPGIGVKAASQIILDIKGELTGVKGDPGVYQEVYEALKTLGFKGAPIDRVLATINEKDASTEDVLRIALAKLRK
ncbi:MAG: Holliday junction branch migration protein RuvA [Erysipelotrichia bacterium]|nr:Holliday junction branch migration protein RuvA [Erysipelotrichia bacterium]